MKMAKKKWTEQKFLLMLRTPYQAWIATHVLRKEKIDHYDLIYFSQKWSEEDEYYYSIVAAGANLSQVIKTSAKKATTKNFIFLMKAFSFFFRKYDSAIMASIDSVAQRALLRRVNGPSILTFDDGAANYNKPKGIFFSQPTFSDRLREKIFGAFSINKTKSLITRHYTLHPSLVNIVEPERRENVGKVFVTTKSELNNPKCACVYLLGYPAEEYLTEEQMRKLTNYLTGHAQIDKYVPHPQEKYPFFQGVPILNKGGKIAEHAILEDGSKKEIHIVGLPSTVIINLAGVVASCTLLTYRNVNFPEDLLRLLENRECKIYPLD